LKKVSIITVNFNQPELTLGLLKSLHNHADYNPYEIIVVDNGSTQDHITDWSSIYGSAKYIRSEKNLGFAGGNNLGIREATGEYLFLINNDTEVTNGLIKKLVKILDDNPEAGVVSPKIRYFDQPDIIQYAGFTDMNFNTGRNRCIGQFEKDNGQYDQLTGPTGYAHGAAMMIRREAINKAGLMPENFFLYYEEMDWCEKIKRSGYQIWIEPKALIFHKESASVGQNSPLKEYYMTRSRLLFIRRNAPSLSKILFSFHFILLIMPRNLLGYLRDGRADLAKEFFKAVWWNLKGGK
jgi:GT2 family glycosyltransferase